MTTHPRSTRLISSIAIAFLITPLLADADDTASLPFLKVGGNYRLFQRNSELPSYIKIIELAAGGWIRVEYVIGPRRQPTPEPKATEASKPTEAPKTKQEPELETDQMWINLATIDAVREYKKAESK